MQVLLQGPLFTSSLWDEVGMDHQVLEKSSRAILCSTPRLGRTLPGHPSPVFHWTFVPVVNQLLTSLALSMSSGKGVILVSNSGEIRVDALWPSRRSCPMYSWHR